MASDLLCPRPVLWQASLGLKNLVVKGWLKSLIGVCCFFAWYSLQGGLTSPWWSQLWESLKYKSAEKVLHRRILRQYSVLSSHNQRQLKDSGAELLSLPRIATYISVICYDVMSTAYGEYQILTIDQSLSKYRCKFAFKRKDNLNRMTISCRTYRTSLKNKSQYLILILQKAGFR